MNSLTAILSISSLNDRYRLKYANFRRCYSAFLTIVKSYYGPLGTGQYLAVGGGRATMREGHNFISLTLGRAIFLKMTLTGGLRIF